MICEEQAMELIMRACQTEEDNWRIREFLREVFLLNDWREQSWHVRDGHRP
jgi:hypothetical protein